MWKNLSIITLGIFLVSYFSQKITFDILFKLSELSETYFLGKNKKNILSAEIFSSPEPKAQGELLWSLFVRSRCRPSVDPQSLNKLSS